MKKLLLVLIASSALLPSCESLTPEERAFLLDRGGRILDRGIDRVLPPVPPQK